MIRIFFDADTLFSVSYTKNPINGVKRILLENQISSLEFTTSQAVINEATENLKKYNAPHSIRKLHDLLKDFNFHILKNINKEQLILCNDLVNEKDVHVLAGALQASADYLLTYNKKHFLTKNFLAKKVKLQMMNPKDFITKVVLHS